MATPRKAATTDPLADELPPEPRPESAEDIRFHVEITSYVVSGTIFYRWQIIDHNAKAYIGDYTGQQDSGYYDATDAQHGAREHVGRIRSAVHLKLQTPDPIRIIL